MKSKSPPISPAVSPVPDPAVQIVIQPYSLNLIDAAVYCGSTKWFLSEQIMAGSLPAKMLGGTRVVLVRDLNNFLDSLGQVRPSSSPSVLRRKQVRFANSNPAGATK
jgi:hypothetical protein